MTWILGYLLIGLIVVVGVRLVSGEPEPIGTLLVGIILWPILLIICVVFAIRELLEREI